MALLTAGTDPDHVEKDILDELHRLTQQRVDEDELSRAFATLEAETLYARDGSFSMASQLNEAIAAGDWKLLPRFLESAMAVTAEAILDSAGRTFVPDQKTTAVYHPIQDTSA